MFTLQTLINDNKLPCFIRKKPINDTVTPTHVNLKATTVDIDGKTATEKRQEQYEKSLFDSLDLLNEEYLETYGIEEINSSRTDKSIVSSTVATTTNNSSSSSSSSASNSTTIFEASTSTNKVSGDNDIVYLCKILTVNCAFARRYDTKNVEDYLNSKYGGVGGCSNASIDLSNENIIHNSAYDLTNIKYEDYVIPSNYEGLLEVLPDYSKQVYDTLDHECDVISFASRLKQPHNYYIAKPLQLFEIVSSSSSQQKDAPTKYDEIEDNYDDLIRKWVTFDVGTIVSATKVLMVVFPPEQKHEKTFVEKVFCNCTNKNKIKFEVAIEFKIVKRFDDLINTVHNDRKKSMHIFNIDLKQIEKLRADTSNLDANGENVNANVDDDDKYYYLPIYHDPNETIDLIPIAPTNSLQLNSLQNIFNLIQHNNQEEAVFEHPIRVRIRVENSFNKLHNLSVITTQSSSFNSNNSSFYEIYARKTAKFLIGYNIKREKFILYAIDDENKHTKYNFEVIEQKLVETIHEKEYLNKVLNVKLNSYLNDFINTFQYNIHKVEFDHVRPPPSTHLGTSVDHSTSSHDITDDDGYVSCKNTKIKNQLVMKWRKKNQYTTFPNPKSKYIVNKVKKYGHTNEAFNAISEDKADDNNNDDDDDDDEINNQQRSRSKSLPDSDVLKASFTNMSSIIEQDQDETKKSKV